MNTIEATTLEATVLDTPVTFYFPSDVDLFLGSAKRKADTNFAVIELVKEIEKEGRFATPDEQDLISHYVGYGDSAVLSARYSEVVEAVTSEEFAALRASTLNAHYTSLPIIRGIWAGLLRMGAGKFSVLRVLDPSAGIGHFQGASPWRTCRASCCAGQRSIRDVRGRCSSRVASLPCHHWSRC